MFKKFIFLYFTRQKTVDWRIVVVLGPIAIALGWALFNIGAAAIRQFQEVLSRES